MRRIGSRRVRLLGALAAAATCVFAAPAAARQPAAAPSARTWIGQEQRMEEHLRTAEVTGLEEIGVGVTRPRRGRLTPAEPFSSLAWKVLPPGRRGGYWESYKSEIAAYELDKFLELRMVPPAVERRIDNDLGAAIMWLDGVQSVKQTGGSVPSGAIWGRAIRQMVMFDNLIGNPDRNAGNILIGAPGEFILIDHSRAFVTDKRLQKFERVDAALWDRMQALTGGDLTRVLRPWIDDAALKAVIARRDAMAAEVDQLVATRGRALVIIP
jgi:hypothetical protein